MKNNSYLYRVCRHITSMNYIFVLLAATTIFFFDSNYVSGQNGDEAQLILIMDEGVGMMEAGNYEDADRKFKQVLRNMDVLPAEICFYFGKNSYFLDLHKQSINWLNKYIELKGTRGRFFEECVNYLNRAEQAFKLEADQNSRQVKDEFSKINEFDCKGKTHFQCPLCKGEGVLIRPGKMNNTIYKTCPFCDGYGVLSCEKYKRYLKGELKADY